MRSDGLDFSNLTVPRRPAWNEATTPDELNRLERESFLDWRRGIAECVFPLLLIFLFTPLARLESSFAELAVTPFEKNLDFWRQLWRVLERSDVVVQA